jgi:hypothetical protein
VIGPRWCSECNFRRWPGECGHSPYQQPSGGPVDEQFQTWLAAREIRVREDWKNGLWPMPIRGHCIPAGTTMNICARPQVAPLLPILLEISDDTCLEDFLIDDIKVGRNSQFTSSGSIPASAFRKRELKDVCGNLPAVDVLREGMSFIITVTNHAPFVRNFAGCVFSRKFTTK